MSNRQLPHIACVTPYVPYPGIDHAGGAYLMRSLDGLRARGWEVTVIAPDTPVNRIAAAQCPAEVIFTGAAPKGVLRRLLRVLRRGTSAPSPVTRNTRALLRDADVIGLHWHESYLWAPRIRRVAPSVSMVATVHDVAMVAAHHARTSAQTLPAWTAAHIAYAALRRHEGDALSICDQLYVFKRSDIDELSRRGCHVPAAVTPPILDLPPHAPAPDPTSRQFVFSAALWREVNHQSALWLLDEVWPLVLAEHPDVRLVIAGAAPRAELEAHASTTVCVSGFTESVVDGYRDCIAALAPVTAGAGLKFKVAQAVAMGFPIVGTTIAFDGFEDLVPGAWTGHDTPADFAAAVSRILADPHAAIREAQSHRDDLLAVTDFDAHLDARDRTYRGFRGRDRSRTTH